MRKLSLGTGAFVGGMLTASLTGIMYLADQLAGLPFAPFELFNWLVRELPGGVVTFGIDAMIDTMRFLGISVVDTAKTAERAMAILQFLAIGAVIGAIFFAMTKARRIKSGPLSGLVAGAIFGLPLSIIYLSVTLSDSPAMGFIWILSLLLIWGIFLSLVQNRLEEIEPAGEAEPEPVSGEAPPVAEVTKLGRRQFLIRLGATTATITVVGGGLGAVLAAAERRRQEQEVAENIDLPAEPISQPTRPNSDAEFVPAPGTRPEITPTDDHYKVFIQTQPIYIDGASWVLPITGLVDNPLTLTVDDFQNNYESRDQYVTISCISGRIGTDLIGTKLWTGVSVQDVLADAGVQENARYLFIKSADGFYETVDLDLINADERIMFCYSWDGRPLPKDHGYPLRIWIPDRYGMKQPKWITEIEVVDEYREGYWVERNWDEVAQVKTTSVIDTVAVDNLIQAGEQTLVPLGGIAFSGDRGISKVEVRVDGGPWQEAQLRDPLSETTWVIWRYEWPFSEGKHTFEVRTAEGDGTPQIEERTGNRPSGATGIHSRDARL